MFLVYKKITTMIKNFLKKIIRTNIVGHYAQFFLDVNRNENNGNMATNGEFLIEKEYVHDNDVIFDVGANVGNWSAHCLDLAPKSHIHAFEPVKKTYAEFINKKFPKNVVANNFALGDKEEIRSITKYGSDHGLGTLHRRTALENDSIGSEEIKVTTLDNYCEMNNITRIDFLKIDVEGHEYAVLQGALGMINKKSIHAIQFEYGQTYVEARTYLKDIYNLFEKKDYTIYKLYPDGPREMTYTYDLENMRYANYLILEK
jgi:FkbM family methyltransferase